MMSINTKLKAVESSNSLFVIRFHTIKPESDSTIFIVSLKIIDQKSTSFYDCEVIQSSPRIVSHNRSFTAFSRWTSWHFSACNFSCFWCPRRDIRDNRNIWHTWWWRSFVEIITFCTFTTHCVSPEMSNIVNLSIHLIQNFTQLIKFISVFAFSRPKASRVFVFLANWAISQANICRDGSSISPFKRHLNLLTYRRKFTWIQSMIHTRFCIDVNCIEIKSIAFTSLWIMST